MIKTVLHMYSSPLFYEETDFKLTDKEKEYVLNVEYRRPKGFNNHSNMSTHTFLLEAPELKRVREYFDKKVKEYTDEILEIENEFYMTQSWSTINYTGYNHPTHNHPNAILSLVYYVDCESGEFYTDRLTQQGYNFNYKVKKYNIHNSPRWKMPVKSQDILIFPAWLPHGSTINNSDKDRLVIGSNYFVKGIMGNEQEGSILEIK
jgi:uncharacterized protein (TIGR02466 family)